MCVFCEIVKGNIPCYKIYENKSCIAFLDLAQVTDGHTIVIPKQHYENIFDLEVVNYQDFLDACVSTAKILKSKLKVEAVNILNNSGSLAGQEVMHLHFHIIPRYLNDKITFNLASQNVSKKCLQDLYEKLKV